MVLAGVLGVELSRTHSVGVGENRYTAILVWPEGVGAVVGQLIENSMDHEHRMALVVEVEVAALFENGTVLHYYPTFPALVAKVVLAEVHCSAVMMILSS